MRLVCPNCEAKYEVPDDAIPDTGRDVQCTNCGHSWFQMRGRTGAAPFVAPAPAEPAVEPAPAPAYDAAEVAAASPVKQPVVVEPEVVPEAVADAAAEAMPAEPVQADHDAAPEGDVIDEAAKAEAASQADPEPAAESAPVLDADPVAEPVAAAVEADVVPEQTTQSDGVAEAASPVPVEGTGAGMVAAEATDAILASSPDAALEAVAEAAADDVPAPAPDYAVDDSVLAILREEAEREANARRAEALESQTDLGIDAIMPRKAPAFAEVDAKPAARRDLLPDVEEINSTLRPSEMQDDDDGPDFVAPPPEAPRGFRSGFLSLMTVAILAAALYLVAPRLSIMVPALSGPLEGYMAIVDSLRLGLDGMMRSATVAISDG